MICDETIEIIHSETVNQVVHSEEDQDYRRLDDGFRYLEDLDIRNLEDGNQRLLE